MTAIQLTVDEEIQNRINELSSDLWILQSTIEMRIPKSEFANTYQPLAEIIKQASWLLDIASNISYMCNPKSK